MKKFTILFLFVAFAIFSYAQNFNVVNKNASPYYGVIKATDLNEKLTSNDKSTNSANISESFESATFPPSGWTLQNPAGGTGWQRQVAGAALPNWTSGSNAAIAPPAPNGGGNAYAIANFSTGGSATTNDQWLISPPLTVGAGDSIKFYVMWYGAYQDYLDIKVSTTTNSTSSFTTNLVTYDSTSFSGHASVWVRKAFSLSSYVGQTIYIAFREHVQNNSIDGSLFALDIVSAGVANANDLAVSQSYLSNSLFGYYGKVPTSQLDNLDFSQVIINNGSATQNNITLSVNLKLNNSSVYTGTSAAYPSLAPLASDTLNVSYLLSGSTGLYEADFNISASGVTDANPSDNVDTIGFYLTNNDYSLCFAPNAALKNTDITSGGNGMIISNEYGFLNSGQLDSIYMYLGGATTAGSTIKGLLYTVNPQTGVATPVDSTALYTITAGDIHNYVTLPFVTSYNTTALSWLRAGFRLNGTVEFLVEKNNPCLDPTSGLYYLPRATGQGGAPAPGWYYFTTPTLPYLGLGSHVNVIITSANSVSDSKESINIYPNPSKGTLNITNANNANVIVYNILGEIVENTICTSAFNTIDLSNLSNGSYIVKVITNDNTITKKINIVK